MYRPFEKILLLVIVTQFLPIKDIGQYGGKLSIYDMEPTYVSRAKGDSIYRYFGVRASQKLCFVFKENVQDSIFCDSLYPKVEQRVDSFIARFKDAPIPDTDDLKDASFKNIYEKIKNLESRKYGKSTETEYYSMYNGLNTLASPRQRVWLLLQLRSIKFFQYPKTKEKLDQVGLYAALEANKIQDLYEKGRSFIYIADIYAQYHINEFAVNLYYKAKEFIDTSNADIHSKYLMEGEISEKLARLFPGKLDFKSVERSNYYYLDALHYFSQIKDWERYYVNAARYLSNWSYLLSTNYITGDSVRALKENAKLLWHLFELENIYKKLKPNSLQSQEIIFLVTNCIGWIMEGGKKNHQAIIYYLNAALLAAEGNQEIGALTRTLTNIADNYTALGNDKLARSYSNLALKLAVLTNNRPSFYSVLFHKSFYNYFLKRYDSALLYVNIINFHLTLNSVLQFPEYNEILEQAYQLKYQILISMKSDSALYYLNIYRDKRAKNLEESSNLLDLDFNNAAGWMGFTLEKEISSEKRLLNDEKLQKRYRLVIELLGGGFLMTCSVIIFIIFKRKATLAKLDAREQDAKRRQFEYENIITQLQIQVQNGKSHEYVSLSQQNTIIIQDTIAEAEHRPELLYRPPKEVFHDILQTAATIENYVTKFHRSTKSTFTTIANEISMSRSFLEVFKFEQPRKKSIIINDNIKDEFVLNMLPTPTHFLNHFIMNSIKHGSKGANFKSLEINISAEKINEDFLIVIEDNGCGLNFERDDFIGVEQRITGFQWAKRVIEWYNRGDFKYNIDMPHTSIFDKSERGLGFGTMVICKFRLK